jgi:hypothetical protein
MLRKPKHSKIEAVAPEEDEERIRWLRDAPAVCQQFYILPTLYLCVLYLSRTNSDIYPLQHKMIGFYNRDEKSSQRGTNWVFK